MTQPKFERYPFGAILDTDIMPYNICKASPPCVTIDYSTMLERIKELKVGNIWTGLEGEKEERTLLLERHAKNFSDI